MPKESLTNDEKNRFMTDFYQEIRSSNISVILVFIYIIYTNIDGIYKYLNTYIYKGRLKSS